MIDTPELDPSANHASLRENILEHAFLGALGRELWRRGCYAVEVLRAEVDAAGYDVVVTVDDATRYIQLKSVASDASTRGWSVSKLLSRKPGACVIVLRVDRRTLDVQDYLYFGGPPGSPLPDISGARRAKRPTFDAKGNRPARENHRNLPRTRFELVPDMPSLVARLFG